MPGRKNNTRGRWVPGNAIRGIVWLTIVTLPLIRAQDTPAREAWVKRGAFIASDSLAGEFAISLRAMGGRLMAADKATTSITGTLTDSTGTRSVRLFVQAPGYLRFQDDSKGHVITYDGSNWQSKNGSENDQRIKESLLANFPDALLLQVANGAGLRRIGSRFRSDNGKTPNYTGPFWTLYAVSPAPRPHLAQDQALQQDQFVALDEKTWLLSEVRRLQGSREALQVTQTKFSNWFERGGQWYPGEIVRLENGRQVLSLAVEGASTGWPLAAQAFQP